MPDDAQRYHLLLVLNLAAFESPPLSLADVAHREPEPLPLDAGDGPGRGLSTCRASGGGVTAMRKQDLLAVLTLLWLLGIGAAIVESRTAFEAVIDVPA